MAATTNKDFILVLKGAVAMLAFLSSGIGGGLYLFFNTVHDDCQRQFDSFGSSQREFDNRIRSLESCCAKLSNR